MIRVLICDDQVVVSEGLKAILSTVDSIEVIVIANNGEQAVESVKTLHPDVALMDLKMPVMNGIQATKIIHSNYPEVHVIVLTTYDFDEWVFDAIRSGASGYLLKDTPRDALVSAIEGTANGRTYIDPTIAGKLLNQISRGYAPANNHAIQSLNEREMEVLRLLTEGMSNSEIASHLFLSEGTIRNYVSSILTKLEVSDRTQAVVLALRVGITEKKG